MSWLTAITARRAALSCLRASALKRRQLLHAGRAPGRPDIDQHRLALEVGQRGLASVRIAKLDVGRGLAGLLAMVYASGRSESTAFVIVRRRMLPSARRRNQQSEAAERTIADRMKRMAARIGKRDRPGNPPGAAGESPRERLGHPKCFAALQSSSRSPPFADAAGRRRLTPAQGEPLPVKPLMARTTPTAEDLLTPPPTPIPNAIDELIKRSQPRPVDRFDLPPAGRRGRSASPGRNGEQRPTKQDPRHPNDEAPQGRVSSRGPRHPTSARHQGDPEGAADGRRPAADPICGRRSARGGDRAADLRHRPREIVAGRLFRFRFRA